MSPRQQNMKRVADGFGSRLQTLMDFAGIRKYGRGRLITEWSGLSNSTASYLFKKDRAPRNDEPIRAIVDGLSDTILSCRSISIVKSDLLDYLMNEITFAELQTWITRVKVSDSDQVCQRHAHLILSIHEAINENNLILKRDSIHSIELISEIIQKVDKFLSSNVELTYESNSVYAYINDLLKLNKKV